MTSALQTAVACIAAASPAAVQPRACRCARSIFQAGMPSDDASWYALPRPADGDPRDGPDAVGERVGDRHRIDADLQRPPQRLQRRRHVADHRRVGDREAADLGPAAVVARDRRRR